MNTGNLKKELDYFFGLCYKRANSTIINPLIFLLIIIDPKVNAVKALMKTLGITIEDLLGEDNLKPQGTPSAPSSKKLLRMILPKMKLLPLCSDILPELKVAANCYND